MEAVVRVAARDFHGALGLDEAGSVVNEVTGHQRIAQAAKALGVTRDAVLKAAQAGLVAHRTSRFGTRGLVYELSDAEVERVRERRQQWIGEAEAAMLADVPPAVLRQMAAAEVIVIDNGWRQDVFKGGPVLRASVIELLEGFNSRVRPRTSGSEPLIAWSELSSRRMGDASAIQAVMKAAAAGELLPLKVVKRLGQAQFLRAEVQSYFGTPLLEAGMSVQQMATATGWKWESIANWIELGLLEAESILLRGQPCRVVSPEQLLRFRQTYIPLADLARAMNTTSIALAGQLPSLEIIGAKTLPSGARRGGLLRLTDLGRLAVHAGTSRS